MTHRGRMPVAGRPGGPAPRGSSLRPAGLASAACLCLLVLLAPAAPAPAYETDQYSARRGSIADSTDVLNRRVNLTLRGIVDRWDHGPSERKLARRIYRRLGGRHWVDRVERFAMRSQTIDQFRVRRRQSIYQDVSPLAGRVVFFFGLGPTIRLADTLIGTDKLGHFFSQGWKYYRRHARGSDEERVVELGLRNETWIFGRATTGVFSNADLVANYEGYLFYRGLFEDGIVAGKPALIAWEGRGARLTRPFDWRDHVNAYWDEALNPSAYDRLLAPRVSRNLTELCPLYARQPERFVPRDGAELQRRYARLGLRDALRFRLDEVCEDSLAAGHAATPEAPGSH